MKNKFQTFVKISPVFFFMILVIIPTQANRDISFESEPIGSDPQPPPTEINKSGGFLIITPPDFLPAAETLQQWKIKKGINTVVVTTNETGETAEEIRDFIQQAYDTWDLPLSYLLLLGDVDYIPTNYLHRMIWGDMIGTDLYYATTEGDDYFPDMSMGRIPVDTLPEAFTVINKIIAYEKTPPNHQQFYENITIASFFDDPECDGVENFREIKSCEEQRDFQIAIGYNVHRLYTAPIALLGLCTCSKPQYPSSYCDDGVYGYGGSLHDDLLYPTYDWHVSPGEIAQSINDGAFLVVHRDHGAKEGWIYPEFNIQDIQQDLCNGNLTPVVFSINCESGWFDQETDEDPLTNAECFGEELLLKENGGAVAVFGATRPSYQGYNDFFMHGCIDAIWPAFNSYIGDSAPLLRLGDVLTYGKYYMNQTWHPDNYILPAPNPDVYGDWENYTNYTRDTFEMYHLLGDPTMEIRTQYPQQLSVIHPRFIHDQVNVIVLDEYRNPVEGALVCLTDTSGLFVRGKTNASGTVTLDVSSAQPGVKNIVVTASNSIPYEGTVRRVLTPVPSIFVELLQGGKP